MAIRRAHGTAAKGGAVVVVETAPADEQRHGIARALPADTRDGRDASGRFVRGSSGVKAIARAGGAAKAGWTRLAHSIGLGVIADDSTWTPYQKAAAALAEKHLAELRAKVGGGAVGVNVRSMVMRAAMQDAASAWHYDKAARFVDRDPKLASSMFVAASRLADAAKASWLTVHELAVKQAPKRAARPGDLDALLGPRRET